MDSPGEDGCCVSAGSTGFSFSTSGAGIMAGSGYSSVWSMAGLLLQSIGRGEVDVLWVSPV